MATPPGDRARSRTHARRFEAFPDLMRARVHDILLVSSLYDSFILAEDGRLTETMLEEFLELDLRHAPGITRVSSGAEALALARNRSRYNLIITSQEVGDMDALALARRVRETGLETPVILLGYDNREITNFVARRDVSALDRVFLWQGDVKILMAIVKFVEDRLNLPHDTGEVGVPAIIVVEDNVRYYSSFLPVIYTELMKHAHRLIPEGLNLAHKLMRIRARPKILLCTTYEEAWDYVSRYPDDILGIISDIEFPRHGELNRLAGLELAREVRMLRQDVPVMLQSSLPHNEALAREVGAAFLLKGSPLLLSQLRQFMSEGFGFGDFVFRLPDGVELDRASNLRTLAAKLRDVPPESLAYHGARNHFSRWLKIRTEFDLAERIRHERLSDFASLEEVRRHLISSIENYRRERNRGIVADFEGDAFDGTTPFSRIGGGSLGGKARGLAFMNYLLSEHDLDVPFPDVRVAVPQAVVLSTDIFDEFLDTPGLRDFAMSSEDDDAIVERFLRSPFPEGARSDLRSFLRAIRHPVAVRSSSLLEDSPYQPFAGIYETFMLPNADPETSVDRVVAAVKRVYASTFSSHAKAYLATTPYRLEEEKMAVIVQRVLGRRHGERFYPDFAGVARSHNFYPTPPLTSKDGIVAVALGLGRTVVEGENCLRFCPAYPRHILQHGSTKDAFRGSQRTFWALEVGSDESSDADPRMRMARLGLDVAERDGVLAALASTVSTENNAMYDGVSRPGVRIVTFAPILKLGLFPLAEILRHLLRITEEGTSSPVEIEFAVDLTPGPDGRRSFGFLQMRPLALSRELEELDLGDVAAENVMCRSDTVLGHGRIDSIVDAVVIDYHRFDRSRSRETAREVARFNAELVAAGRPYVLLGVGRWGSTDPWLGIPVTWDQIAGARVIVEAGFKDTTVTPSQGTHFFQNLTSCNVGYFTVNPESGDGYVDWEWLSEHPAVAETSHVRHLRFVRPIVVAMNGKTNEGVILKP